ncbi:MAG: hypothetical protein NT121_04345 [Chloroflexi bacterium]|nr:hypothetical protein [Chloroflexota bacterium]
MQTIVDFFNLPIFIVLGGISTFLTLAAAIYAIYLFVRGIFPVWYRLGVGLSRRKIAIFAESEFDGLKSILLDSGLFLDENVVQIHRGSIKKAEGYTLFLMHWKSFEAETEEILRLKKDSTALIVYAPQSEGFIEPSALGKINQQRNAIVVNLRGRLLNDVLVSMITTGYKAH